MVAEYHPLAREAMHKAQYSRRIRAAIDQIADKPQLIAIAITRLVQQAQQRLVMPVYITNRQNRHNRPSL